MSYLFHSLKHLRACYVGNQPCFCACENVMLHWIRPVLWKWSTCLQDHFLIVATGLVFAMRPWCESFLGNKHEAKISQAYTVTSITDCWPCFNVHADCCLHMLLLASPAVCCYPWTVDCHNDDYITTFNCAGGLWRRRSQVLVTDNAGCTAYCRHIPQWLSQIEYRIPVLELNFNL